MLEDNKKNLWLGSLSGILKLNARRNEIGIYGKKYGVNANSLFDMAGYSTPAGELLFGDATGYYAFFPDQLTTNTKAPKVILTDFKIAELPVKPGNNSPFPARLVHIPARLRHSGGLQTALSFFHSPRKKHCCINSIALFLYPAE